MIRLGVAGACGKMGSRILALASKDKDFKITLALERLGHNLIGDKIEGLEATSDVNMIKNIDGLIDFSSVDGTLKHLEAVLKFKKPCVIGTTGFDDAQKKIIFDAAKKVPIVFSPNMSLGVNLLFKLVKDAAAKLSSEYKVTMTEAHHVHKKDAPSGTAKFLADIVKKERGLESIDIKSIREGEIIGDHDVVFESPYDTIKLSHHAKTRDIFVLGALSALKFIARKKNGLYSMADVLEGSD